MRRVAKWVGAVFAVLIVVVVGLPFLINVDQFRPTLQTELSTALGREVTLGNLRLRVLSGELTADDLTVAEDPAFGKPAFLHAKSLHVGVEIMPFIFSRKLIVTDLNIDEPEIALVQAPSGDWNFSTLGSKSKGSNAQPPASAQAPLNLSVKLIKISSGRLSLRRTIGHWKPLVLEQVNIEMRDFSSTAKFPFSLSAQVHGGGSLKLDGSAGPINSADSAMTPVSVNLDVAQLDLSGSGVNDVAPAVTGIASLNGKAESDGANLQIEGKLKGEKLKFVRNGSPATRPIEIDFSVQHDLKKHSGMVRQGDVHIGAAVAHLTGSYAENGDSMTLNMKLSGPGMPVQELEAMLPAIGVVLPAGTSLRGGSASANLSMQGPTDRLATTGSLAVNNTQLVGFDLPKKMSAIEKLAGIQSGPNTEIQTLRANVKAAALEGISVQDISLVVPAIGEVSGAGTISPSNNLDFRMTTTVHASGLLSVVGNEPIPFIVEGTCSNPIFKPDLKAVVRENVKGLLPGDVGKAAGGLLNGLLGGKKKK